MASKSPGERYESEIGNVDTFTMSICFDALRDMIASLDAELGRLTETVNRQERIITDRASANQRTLDAMANRVFDIETACLAAPDTVAFPRSLMAALERLKADSHPRTIRVVGEDTDVVCTSVATFENIMDEYDAWKAGQS